MYCSRLRLWPSGVAISPGCDAIGVTDPARGRQSNSQWTLSLNLVSENARWGRQVRP